MTSTDEFVRERNAALLSLDERRIRTFMREHGVAMPSSKEAFWRGVHKARTACKGLPMAARRESRRWLQERGSASQDDGDVA